MKKALLGWIVGGCLILGVAVTAGAVDFAIGPTGAGGNGYVLGSGWGTGANQVNAAFLVSPSLASTEFTLTGRYQSIAFQYGSIALLSGTIPSSTMSLSVTAYLNFLSPANSNVGIPATTVAIPGTVFDAGEDLRLTFESVLVPFWGSGLFQIDLYPDASFTWTGTRNLFARVTLIDVPEPATIMLLGFGLVGIAGLRRRISGSC